MRLFSSRAAAVISSLVVTVSVVVGLSGCSSEPAEPAKDLSSLEIPSYYPKDYSGLIDKSKEEGGELVLYSNVDQENLAPILRDFKSRYPWTKVSSENLDSDVIFQRQLSEAATSGTKADILISNAIQAWAEYAATKNAVLDYQSPELSQLPDFAKLAAGVYAVSFDPVGLTYNTQLFPGSPTSLQALADIVAKNPSDFKGRITARDIKGAYGFTASRALVDARPQAWDSLAKILPVSRPESSSGTQNEKVLSGEYSAGIVVSSAPAYAVSVAPATSGLFKFVLPTDGAVVLGRGMGITPGAPHQATAKLFLDFVLSEVGQNAVAEGGLAAYRDSVKTKDGQLTYAVVEKAVGADQIIRVPYEVVSEADQAAFTDRWNSLTK
jgi:iron(III) transport system substrate-binding protein